MAITPFIGKWMERTVSYLLPPLCVVCEARLQTRAPVGICPQCWGKLPRLDVTAEPALTDMLARSTFGHFYAPFTYEGEVIGLLTRLKYYQAPHLAQAVVPFMSAALPDATLYDVAVPVPVDRVRLLKRGYNQAAEIVRLLAPALHLPFDMVGLVRVKRAGRQVGRTKDERRKALAGAFAADARFKGKSVLLVDDVLTTGSTADACAKALRAAGATRVDVLTAAWVRP
ncbi:MAG: hypothetical protein GC134_00250 [Proteobacteria bacterium]|nr:hypothetical protein [Pseudomonadota bacterium]